MDEDVTQDKRLHAINDIAQTPELFCAALEGLTDEQLGTPYREGGWTVKQLTHHLTDSHMNAFARWKLTLTENEPTIQPYDEKRWAELADSVVSPGLSLTLLSALHERWVALLLSLKPEQFALKFRHADHGTRTLDWLLFLYAWHGRHHTAHVNELRRQKGW